MTGDSDMIGALLGTLAADAPPRLVGRVLTHLDLGDHFTAVDAPAGPVFIAYSKRGISMACPAMVIGGRAEEFVDSFRRRFGRPLLPGDAAPPLRSAVASGNTAGLTYDLAETAPFTRSVLQAILAIPCGEVRSYGWVARRLGNPGAARAVGSALHANPVPVLIPCHRVVRSDGSLGGYAYGSEVKKVMLEAEAVAQAGAGRGTAP